MINIRKEKKIAYMAFCRERLKQNDSYNIVEQNSMLAGRFGI